jgi:hypothetical protein
MHEAIRENDLIVLQVDIPEYELPNGRIGRVLQVFTPDEAEVEFVDDGGHTVAKVRLSPPQFIVLRHESTLDEEAFWNMIEDAKADSNNDIERQFALLVERLANRPIADIFAFGNLFHEIRGRAYRRELWAAASVICGGCGDSCFKDFRAWLIAQGKKVFYDALGDPETLVDVVQVKCNGIFTYGDARFESMNYADVYAYENKMEEEIPTFFGIYNSPELIGESWDEATAEQKYPRLAKKFEPKECNE